MLLVHLLLSLVLPLWVSTPAPRAVIEGLVQQLGSPSYRQREAATMALEVIGEPALAALRQAANGSTDAEIRRRASMLAQPLEERREERVVEAIKSSRLHPEEKGRRLVAVIRPGMSMNRVARLLGRHCYIHGNCSGGTVDWHNIYAQYGLEIGYAKNDGTVHTVLALRSPK
jgi:hypothetical protein